MRPALTVLASVLLAVLPTAIAPAAQAAPAADTLPLTEAVAQLPVAAEDRTGYDREQSFGGWIDADRDGCNTRMEVLLEEAVEAPAVTGRCTLSGGRWYSWYDDTFIDGPRGIDIDHLVPLAEAWDSGASTWTRQRRVTYANYLDDDRHLEAVSARSNRQKADQDPTTWFVPDNPAERCHYLANWTAVKLQWGMTVDPAEQDTLASAPLSAPAPTSRQPRPLTQPAGVPAPLDAGGPGERQGRQAAQRSPGWSEPVAQLAVPDLAPCRLPTVCGDTAFRRRAREVWPVAGAFGWGSTAAPTEERA